MERLGLGYEALRGLNRSLIYATITGFNSLMVMIGMTVGPLFSGFIRDLTGNYRYAFLTLAAVAVVASVAAILARPPGLPGDTEPVGAQHP